MLSFKREQDTIERKELIYQVLSWDAFDEEIEKDISDDEEEDQNVSDKRYHIYSFGVNESGESVCVRFESYRPYFFALVPEKYQLTFNMYSKNEVERFIRNKLYKSRDDLISVDIVERKKYKGFTNNKKFKFLRFVCKNLYTFNRIRYILNPKEKSRLPKISTIDKICPLKFDLYESNIDPYLRFTHKMDIKMAGWITVKNITQDIEMSRCQHSYICHYNNAKPYEKLEICNMTIGSWDIEAFSHSSRYENTNEFPNPENPLDIITQIGTSLYKFGTREKIKHVVTIKSPTACT